IISVATINAIEQLTGMKLDIRRFRPNLVVETIDNQPFEEQKWCSSNIHIEDTLLRIYMDDIRCAMVNINPDSGEIDTKILKAIVQANNNCAGSYARVIGTGTILVDSKLYLET
ncbi:MAG: MOSC domain-containing protein, partial [Blastocatellia bacterium]